MRIQIQNYTFNASAKTITFDDYTDITLDSIISIVSATDSKALYNPINKNLSGSVATNIFTLDFDTTLMNNNDSLIIYYDDDTIPIATSNPIDEQNPVPSNGDSIYIKDLIESENDIGTFNGVNADISNLFNGFSEGIIDDSSVAIKWFEFHINRPQITGAIGMVAETGHFSNVKVEFLDRQNNVIQTMNDTSSNTKHTQRRYPVTAKGFCCVKVYFHTTDTVNVNFVRISKDQAVTARMKLLKPDGTEVEAQGTSSGNFKTSIEEFDSTFYDNPLPITDLKLEIAKGNITGISQVDKFGKNSDIDSGSTPEDCWNGGGLYTGFSDIVETLEVFSDDANDTSAGTGARTVEVSGLLDENYNEMPPITVTLNGVTPVSLGTQTYLRCNRVRVLTAGSNNANIGVLTIRHTTTTVNIFAKMPIGHNQTTIFAYTVPLGKTLFVERISINMSRVNGSAGSANVSLRVRLFGEVFQAKRTPQISNSDGYLFANNGYLVLPEKTDSVLRIDDVSDLNTTVSGEMDGILVTN